MVTLNRGMIEFVGLVNYGFLAFTFEIGQGREFWGVIA